MKELLGLPADCSLPSNDGVLRRTTYPRDVSLSEEALAAVRDWYAEDYLVLAIGESFRQSRSSSPPGQRSRAS